MATSTTNLALTKSAGSENYSIDIVNANLDKIDAGCVNVSQTQDITGYKRFTSSIARKATNINMSTTPSSQETAVHFDALDNNNTPIVRLRTYHETSGTSELSIIVPKQGWNGSADYQQPRLRFCISTDGSSVLLAPSRTYDASHINDVVTISSLQASTDVVHTVGDETINGLKTFNYSPRGMRYISTTSGQKELFRIPVHTDLSSVTIYLTGRLIDKSNASFVSFLLTFRTSTYTPTLLTSAPIAGFYVTLNSDSTVSLWCGSQRVLAYIDTISRANYTSEFAVNTYVTIGTRNLNSKPVVGDDFTYVVDSTLMGLVDTTSTQTIGGAKTFTSGLVLTAYQAETISMTGGPKIGTNTVATQSIMRLMKNANDTDYVARDTVYQGANTKNTARLWYLQRQNSSGDGVDSTSITLGFSDTGTYVQAPVRTYNASYTSDVVTIGSLQSSTDVVHSSGNETIGGNKTFTKAITGYASGKYLGACGPNNANAGNIYLMAKINNLPNNEGCVFHIVGGLNNLNYVYAVYRAFKVSSTMSIQCIFKSYTGPYQKPKLYIYNNNGTIEIYGTSMSWCVPNLFFDYWENGGLYYYNLNRYTMTASTDFSTVSLPSGAIAETGLLTEM